jgi:hypothetical protein
MADLPFNTFRLRLLEEAGMRKIPKHLKEYYWDRKQLEISGFAIQKPITAAELAIQCYDQVFPNGFIDPQCLFYAIDVEEFHDFYAFTVSLC